jgi:hypothetical protein
LNALKLQKITLSVVLLASAPRFAKPSFPPNLTAELVASTTASADAHRLVAARSQAFRDTPETQHLDSTAFSIRTAWQRNFTFEGLVIWHQTSAFAVPAP